MERLDSLSFSHLLALLDVTTAARLGAASRHLRQAVSSDRALWNRLCREHFGVADDGSHELYLEQCRSFGRYRSVGFGALVRAFSALQAAFADAGCGQVLLPGASEEELNDLERKIGYRLPLAARASLRLHNGQRPVTKASHAALGWYSFYDAMCALVLLGTSQVSVADGGGVAVAVAAGTEQCALVVHYDGEVSWNNTFLAAPSWSCYISNLAEYIRVKALTVTRERGLNLFPRSGVPTQITRGIGVSCSPLFVPARSSPEHGVYTFTYSIRIFGTPQLAFRARLLSREWRINASGAENEPEIVRGPGVVGLHPVASAGSDFNYESVCQCLQRRGWMEGHFVFKIEGSGEELIVPVPRFELNAPALSKHFVNQ